MKRQFHRLIRSTAFGLCLAASTAGQSQVQVPKRMFEDVPKTSPLYEAAEQLREAGVIIGYPGGYFNGKRVLTYYEFAVAVDRIGTVLMTEPRKLPAKLPELLASRLKVMVDELLPELRCLVRGAGDERVGVLQAYARGLAVMPGRFLDVPRDHWAADTVESLRRRGILIGYPKEPDPPAVMVHSVSSALPAWWNPFLIRESPIHTLRHYRVTLVPDAPIH